jgi:hypothetical protein
LPFDADKRRKHDIRIAWVAFTMFAGPCFDRVIKVVTSWWHRPTDRLDDSNRDSGAHD